MSKADSWMPLWIGDYLADTMHLSAAEHGAYLLLLMHSWRRSAPPDDDAQLGRIARMTPEEWARARPSIEAFFRVSNGVWAHDRLEFERNEAADRAARLGRRGKAAAAAKAAKRATREALENQTPTSSASKVELNDNPPPSPSLTEKQTPTESVGAPSASSRRGSRLPDGWVPSGADRAVARELGLNPDAVADRFRDFWRAKAGKEAVKLDWSATWRNWCRSDADKRGSNPIPLFNGGPNEFHGHAAERRTYGGGGTGETFRAAVAAIPELAGRLEGD